MVIDLSRNFGKEAALTAGLDHALQAASPRRPLIRFQVIIGSELRRSVGESADGLGVLAGVERGDGGLRGGRGKSRNGRQVAFLLTGAAPSGLQPARQHCGPCGKGVVAKVYLSANTTRMCRERRVVCPP